MTKTRLPAPIPTCRLCKQHRELCDSHLIPKSMYRLLARAAHPSLTNRSPVLAGKEKTLISSHQFKNYLLCVDCEGRFSKNGETWVMRNCFRAKQGFFLREQLQTIEPTMRLVTPDMTVYAATQVPTIKTDHLIYFGMSVFWRAGVHQWRIRDYPEPVGTELGPYEEPIRQFLLGGEFPAKMRLSARIISDDRFANAVMLPHSCSDDGFRIHAFSVPGIEFYLLIGSKIPKEAQLSLSGSPERFLYLSRSLDLEGLKSVQRTVAKHRAWRLCLTDP